MSRGQQRVLPPVLPLGGGRHGGRAGDGMAGDRPPRRPAEPSGLIPSRRTGAARRAYCGASPMVTTSLQSVHATPSGPFLLYHRRGAAPPLTTTAPTKEMSVSDGTSLSGLVRAAARQRPEAPAVVTVRRRLDWAQLDAAIDRAAAGYAARGLAPGDRVAVQLPNGVDWLCAAIGALRAGLVVVPVNTAYTDPELEHVLGDSGAALLVARGERPPVAGVPVCSGPPEADGAPPEVAEDPGALAFLAYTSGTTGRPRGAMLTHAALRANQEQCLAMDPPPVREDDRVLLVLPLFHVYGLNAGFGLVAATGACVVLQETFHPRAALALMEAEQVTAVPGAPPMYQAWLAVANADGSDAALRRAFAGVRVASSGAAPLPEQVWTALRERAAVTVWEGYGLTEAGPVVAS